MLSILGSILGAGLRWCLSYFMPSKDEKLGQLEVKSQEQGQALDAIKKANAAANAPLIDSMSDPNNRDGK